MTTRIMMKDHGGYTEFGKRLRKLRVDRSLTQDELAIQVDASRQAVSNWENGVDFPNPDRLINMRDFFHVSLDYLVCGSDYDEPYPRNGS